MSIIKQMENTEQKEIKCSFFREKQKPYKNSVFIKQKNN